MRKKKKCFDLISQFCDVVDILILAKVKGLEHYKKVLKKRLKEMLYEGLSTRKRIDYWMTIGRILEKKENHKLFYEELQSKKSKSEMAISVDIARTYPNLEFFRFGKNGYQQLSCILKAISLVFPKIGYCQGMNFFSAIILLILNNEEVFFS